MMHHGFLEDGRVQSDSRWARVAPPQGRGSVKPRAPCRWPLDWALRALTLWMPANGGCVRAADLDHREQGAPAAQTSTEGLETSQAPGVPLSRIC
jgi:hypothetical protein